MKNNYTSLDIKLIGSGQYSRKELAEIFNTTPGAITQTLRRNGLKNNSRRNSHYSNDEMNFIKKNWIKANDKEMADFLKITVSRVKSIRIRLGLKRKQRKIMWTPEQLEDIRTEKTVVKLANKYGVSTYPIDVVKSKFKKGGVK